MSNDVPFRSVSFRFVLFRYVKYNKPGQIPGWKKYCEASNANARAACLHWMSCGKPRYGQLFVEMTQTRAYFKYTLRQCRLNVDHLQSDNLAKKLLSKDTK